MQNLPGATGKDTARAANRSAPIMEKSLLTSLPGQPAQLPVPKGFAPFLPDRRSWGWGGLGRRTRGELGSLQARCQQPVLGEASSSTREEPEDRKGASEDIGGSPKSSWAEPSRNDQLPGQGGPARLIGNSLFIIGGAFGSLPISGCPSKFIHKMERKRRGFSHCLLLSPVGAFLIPAFP